MGVFSSELSEFGAKSALLDIFMRPYSSAEAKISQTRGQFWLWKIQIGPWKYLHVQIKWTEELKTETWRLLSISTFLSVHPWVCASLIVLSASSFRQLLPYVLKQKKIRGSEVQGRKIREGKGAAALPIFPNHSIKDPFLAH